MHAALPGAVGHLVFGCGRLPTRSDGSGDALSPRRNPRKSPRAPSHRETTWSTRPGAPPPFSASSSDWQAARSPSATTATRPSSRLRAEPDQPELERPSAGPPAEADALDHALHPRGEPDGRSFVSLLTGPRRLPTGRGRNGRPGTMPSPCHPDGRRSGGYARDERRWAVSVVDNAIYVDGRRELAPPSLDTAFSALRSCPDDGRSFAWIGMLRPGRTRSTPSPSEFGLHELAVEDTVNQHQRPKLERYGDTHFVVLRPARYVDPVEVIKLGELHVFLGPDFVITVRHADEPDLARGPPCLEDDPELLAPRPVGRAVRAAGPRRRRLRARAGGAAGRHRPDRGAGLRRRRRRCRSGSTSSPARSSSSSAPSSRCATSSRSCAGGSARTATHRPRAAPAHSATSRTTPRGCSSASRTSARC